MTFSFICQIAVASYCYIKYLMCSCCVAIEAGPRKSKLDWLKEMVGANGSAWTWTSILNANWHKYVQSLSEAVGNVIFLNVENTTYFMTWWCHEITSYSSWMHFQTQFHGKSTKRLYSLQQMSAWWWRRKGGAGISKGDCKVESWKCRLHFEIDKPVHKG